MNAPHEHYAEFYNAHTDAYDLDAYAEAVHLDELGMWSPAYEALVRGDLAVMEAYNDERASADSTRTRAAAWLVRFDRVIYAWPMVLVVVGLVASALGG
jgi:hypothetical protein